MLVMVAATAATFLLTQAQQMLQAAAALAVIQAQVVLLAQ
jgi:hypothetical protein